MRTSGRQQFCGGKMSFRMAVDGASRRYRQVGMSLCRWGSIVAGIALALSALSAAAQTSPVTGVDLIAGGGSHSCLVLATGAAKCWGSDSNGQVGDNATAFSRPT